MRKLSVFDHLSLDGYFVDRNGDMSWAKTDPGDPEWDAFVADNARGGSELLFGRITYELMAGFWPTPFAIETMPEVAARMNTLPKIVFSRSLTEASWSNTTLVSGDLIAETHRLKSRSGPDMVILGSGSIVAQLARAGLIDDYQLVVNPVALGAGRTLFEDTPGILRLKRTATRAFRNGKVLLCYEPQQ